MKSSKTLIFGIGALALLAVPVIASAGQAQPTRRRNQGAMTGDVGRVNGKPRQYWTGGGGPGSARGYDVPPGGDGRTGMPGSPPPARNKGAQVAQTVGDVLGTVVGVGMDILGGLADAGVLDGGGRSGGSTQPPARMGFTWGEP